MREKKEYVIYTFHTTTAAMAMEKACEKMQIPGRLIPVPREITAGCGLSFRILKEEQEQYADQIAQLGIPFEEIVLLRL